MYTKITLVLSLALLLNGCAELDLDSKKQRLPGERLSIIDISTDLLPNDSFHNGSSSLSNILPSCNDSLDDNLVINKKFKINTAYSIPINANPIVANDKLIVMHSEGYITAYNNISGKLIWRSQPFHKLQDKKLSYYDYINGNMAHLDGVIYATLGINVIVALDANSGKILWLQTISSPTRSTPLISGDKLLIQSIDNNLYALNIKNGERIWKYMGISEGISIFSSASPVTSNNKAFIQLNTGELVALNIDTGVEEWIVSGKVKSALNVNSHLHSTVLKPVIDNKILFLCTPEVYLSAINVEYGSIVWQKQFYINKPICICGDFIYAINNLNQLISVSKHNGMIKWVKNLADYTNKKVSYWAAPITAGNEIIAVNSDGNLLKFDNSTGDLKGKMQIDKEVELPPLVANGNMYITSNRGNITQYSKK